MKRCQIKIFLAFSVFSLLFSCSTLNYIGTPNIKHKNISIPEKKQIVTANLGMNMITQAKASIAQGIHISKKQMNGFVKIGDYIPTQENEKKIIFENYPNGEKIKGDFFGCDTYALVYYKATKKLEYEAYGGAFNVKQQCDSITDFSLKEVMSISTDNFQQTLIYLGKFGHIIKLAYREFSDDFIRPNFSTEVFYDLSENSIIGYMNCRIEIIEATNSYIKYKVLENFNE